MILNTKYMQTLEKEIKEIAFKLNEKVNINKKLLTFFFFYVILYLS